MKWEGVSLCLGRPAAAAAAPPPSSGARGGPDQNHERCKFHTYRDENWAAFVSQQFPHITIQENARQAEIMHNSCPRWGATEV